MGKTYQTSWPIQYEGTCFYEFDSGEVDLVHLFEEVIELMDI